jgi:hypothetical protein
VCAQEQEMQTREGVAQGARAATELLANSRGFRGRPARPAKAVCVRFLWDKGMGKASATDIIATSMGKPWRLGDESGGE